MSGRAKLRLRTKRKRTVGMSAVLVSKGKLRLPRNSRRYDWRKPGFTSLCSVGSLHSCAVNSVLKAPSEQLSLGSSLSSCCTSQVCCCPERAPCRPAAATDAAAVACSSALSLQGPCPGAWMRGDFADPEGLTLLQVMTAGVCWWGSHARPSGCCCRRCFCQTWCAQISWPHILTPR